MSTEPETKPRNVGRPLLFATAEALETALDKAIAKLRKTKRPLIVENIALELNCSPSTLSKYRERADFKPEYLQPIKKMLETCQAWQASKLFEGGQVAGPIFALKNNFPEHYRDKIEQDIDLHGDMVVQTVDYSKIVPALTPKPSTNANPDD